MWVFLVLILVPLVEIGLFVTLGGVLGLFWTLGIVIGSAAMGALIIRREHRAASVGLRETLQERRDLSRPAAHAAMGLAAGFLLMAPGFLTDSVGLLLLIPATRRAIFGWFVRYLGDTHMVFSTVTVGRAPNKPDGDIIEGEVIEREDTPASKRPQSPSDEENAQPRRVTGRH